MLDLYAGVYEQLLAVPVCKVWHCDTPVSYLVCGLPQVRACLLMFVSYKQVAAAAFTHMLSGSCATHCFGSC